MQIEHIPVDTIEIPEVRVTSYMTDEVAQQFALSVQAAGVMQPLHCLRDDGHIILVDGLHRLQEARARGDATIACVVIPGDLRTALLQNLVTSGLRGRPKASEMRKVIGALGDEFQMDSIAIRKATGLSQDYIERLMWVNQAHPGVQRALDDEEISVGHAYALARIERLDVQERILDLCLMNRWSIDSLRHHIKLVQDILDQPAAAPTPLAAPEPRLAPCHFCRQSYNPTELAMYAMCPVCAGALWQNLHQSPAPHTD